MVWGARGGVEGLDRGMCCIMVDIIAIEDIEVSDLCDVRADQQQQLLHVISELLVRGDMYA